MAFLTFVLVKYVPCEVEACMTLYSVKTVMFRVTIRQDMLHTYVCRSTRQRDDNKLSTAYQESRWVNLTPHRMPGMIQDAYRLLGSFDTQSTKATSTLSV